MADNLYIDLYPIVGPGGYQYGRIELDTLIADHGALVTDPEVESLSPLVTVSEVTCGAATVGSTSYSKLLMWRVTAPAARTAERVPMRVSYHCQYRRSNFLVYARLAKDEVS